MKGYSEWARKHAIMFGLQSAQDIDMLASWEAIFEKQGVTAEDLSEVSKEMATDTDAPKWRSEHLAKIQKHISNRNAARLKAERMATGQDEPTCPDCRGSGFATVPNPKCIVDGLWVPRIAADKPTYYEAAVACSCIKGEALHKRYVDRKDKTMIPMKLEDFQKICPTWREQMRQVAERKRQERQASGAAKNLDNRLGPILRRITENLTKERP